jgi:hypothetical protein
VEDKQLSSVYDNLSLDFKNALKETGGDTYRAPDNGEYYDSQSDRVVAKSAELSRIYKDYDKGEHILCFMSRPCMSIHPISILLKFFIKPYLFIALL